MLVTILQYAVVYFVVAYLSLKKPFPYIVTDMRSILQCIIIKGKKTQQALKNDSHRKSARLFTTNAVINLCVTEYSFMARKKMS